MKDNSNNNRRTNMGAVLIDGSSETISSGSSGSKKRGSDKHRLPELLKPHVSQLTRTEPSVVENGNLATLDAIAACCATGSPRATFSMPNQESLEYRSETGRTIHALREEYGRVRIRLVPEIVSRYRVDVNEAEALLHSGLEELFEKHPAAGAADEADFNCGVQILRKIIYWRFIDQVRHRRFEQGIGEFDKPADGGTPEQTYALAEEAKLVSSRLNRLFAHLHSVLSASLSRLAEEISAIAEKHGLGSSLEASAMAFHAMLFHDCEVMGLPPRKQVAAESAKRLDVSLTTFDTQCCRLRRHWKEALEAHFGGSLGLAPNTRRGKNTARFSPISRMHSTLTVLSPRSDQHLRRTLDA